MGLKKYKVERNRYQNRKKNLGELDPSHTGERRKETYFCRELLLLRRKIPYRYKNNEIGKIERGFAREY